MLRRARYCHNKSSVCSSVRLSVCDVERLKYCGHIARISSKIIAHIGLVRLGSSFSAAPNIISLVQRGTYRNPEVEQK